MARADLSAMLGRLESSPGELQKDPGSEFSNTPQSTLAERDLSSQTPTRVSGQDSSPPRNSGRGYLSFDRKEARLRADQYAKLTQEARRLNKAKGTGGERITENTLIRVAIDLLLERADELAGVNESELRKSVTP